MRGEGGRGRGEARQRRCGASGSCGDCRDGGGGVRRRATPQSLRASSPYTGEPRTTPQSAAGGQLPLHRGAEATPQSAAGGQLPPSHRNIPSECPGVAHGLFYDQAALWLDLQNAHASGSLRSPCGYRGAEGNPSVAARQLPLHRGAKGNPSVRCGGQLPLHRGAKATPQSAASGQLPLHRGAKDPFRVTADART